MTRPVVLLFAKYPTPGRVKTRLARQIGAHAAASRYKEMVETLVRELKAVPTYTLTCCYDPPDHDEAFRSWLPQLTSFLAQSPGDLGQRMETAIEDALSHGAPAAIVIGSDCIDLNKDILKQAIAALNESDVVIGPAVDGGYYLIGMKKPHPELFHNMTWSHQDVYRETIRRSEQQRLNVAALPVLADLDHL